MIRISQDCDLSCMSYSPLALLALPQRHDNLLAENDKFFSSYWVLSVVKEITHVPAKNELPVLVVVHEGFEIFLNETLRGEEAGKEYHLVVFNEILDDLEKTEEEKTNLFLMNSQKQLTQVTGDVKFDSFAEFKASHRHSSDKYGIYIREDYLDAVISQESKPLPEEDNSEIGISPPKVENISSNSTKIIVGTILIFASIIFP